MFIKQLQQANTPAAQAAIINAACTKARKQINTITCARTLQQYTARLVRMSQLHPAAHALNAVIQHANKRMPSMLSFSMQTSACKLLATHLL